MEWSLIDVKETITRVAPTIKVYEVVDICRKVWFAYSTGEELDLVVSGGNPQQLDEHMIHFITHVTSCCQKFGLVRIDLVSIITSLYEEDMHDKNAHVEDELQLFIDQISDKHNSI
jgi:hypothetical protein